MLEPLEKMDEGWLWEAEATEIVVMVEMEQDSDLQEGDKDMHHIV